MSCLTSEPVTGQMLMSSEGESSMPNSASSLAPPPSSVPAPPSTAGEPPVQNIQMRSLIVTGDASVIIGRAGAHVNEIRASHLKHELNIANNVGTIQRQSDCL
jgi:hypothetical protein